MSPRGDTLSLESRVPDGPSTYDFRTAHGLHSHDEFRDSELLLLDVLWERDLGDFLVVQANYGVLGTILGAVASTVTMTETSARAARFSRHNAERNGRSGTVSLVPSPADLDSTFQTACYAPKPYTPIAVGKQYLVDALSTLATGGELYVAARKSSGLGRYEECLSEHSQSLETVRKDGPVRVLRAEGADDSDPPVYDSPKEITAKVSGQELRMQTRDGLFSANELDHGTRLLLETVDVVAGERILDVACGYGPVGAYAAASGAGDVVLTDDDVRATTAAKETLDATGVDGTVVTADCLRGVDGPFDRVLSNPPTHAGRGVLTDLFDGIADVLVSGGELSVVHHRELDLDRYLDRVGRVTDRTHGEEHTVVTVSTV